MGARGGTLLAEGGQTETWGGDSAIPRSTVAATARSHTSQAGARWSHHLGFPEPRQRRSAPTLELASHIRRLISSNFEGLPPGIGLYRATVRRPAYDIDLWVFFKSVHPAPRVIAKAQAELDRLRLPEWPVG